jgi:hypothetical protein
VATFKHYIYFIIQLILKEEDENSFDLDSISKKINIYEEKISFKKLIQLKRLIVFLVLIF